MSHMIALSVDSKVPYDARLPHGENNRENKTWSGGFSKRIGESSLQKRCPEKLLVRFLGFVCLVIFYGCYHGIHHHYSPPFGRICFGSLFPGILARRKSKI